MTIPAGMQAADNTPAGKDALPPASMRKTPVTRAPEDWKFKVSASDIVYDTPQGKESMWSKSGSYYSMSIFGIGEGSSADMPCTVVEGDDGSFWVYNPFSALDSRTWLRSEINGDRMTVKLPQAIYADEYEGTQIVYVAQLCHFEKEDPMAEDGLYYCEDGETEITFLREGDAWVMQTQEMNDHPMIMGLVSADDGSWCAYSDWDTAYAPFSEKTVEVPAGLETEPWSLIFATEDAYAGGTLVNIGFDGTDVYMGGFSSLFPDAWIKGSLADGRITFPSKQYLGANGMANSFGYFFGAVEEEVYNEEWGFSYMETKFADDLTFDYDAQTHKMTTDGTFLVNRGAETTYIEESYTAPRLGLQGEVTDFTPIDPIPGFFTEPGDYMGALYFSFAFINRNDQILDRSNLYYCIFVDDDVFTFYPDEYNGLEEPVEAIPFSFINSDSTIGYYGTADLTHFFQFSFTGYETIDLQTFYLDGDREYASAKVNVIGRDAVDEVYEGTPAAEEWYDLAGRRVVNPDKGIYIRRSLYTDGTARSSKVAVK